MAVSSMQRSVSQHLENVSDLARMIDASTSADESFRLLTQGVCEYSKWDMSGIQVLDLELALAIPVARYDPYNGGDLQEAPGWDTRISPVEKVLKERKPLVLRDAAAQSEYPGFREDAIQRGYHTIVMIPLGIRDAEQRPMVYSVASRDTLDLAEEDLRFLQCVAELSTIAIRKVRELEHRREQAFQMQSILESLTSSLTKSLRNEAANSIARGLSQLFPAGWLAVDLTSGEALHDSESPPPVPLPKENRAPAAFIAASAEVKNRSGFSLVEVDAGDRSIRVQASPLSIDGSSVGALFFFSEEELGDRERTAAQAGQLALSAYIMRGFIRFKTRRVTARQLMMNLFDGDWRKREKILDDAHRLDFDLDAPFRLMMIRFSQQAEIDDGMHSFVLGSARAAFGSAISCILGGALVLMLTDPADNIDDRKAHFDRHMRSLPLGPVLLLLSERIEDIRQLPKQKEMCENALQVAGSLGADGWVSPLNLGEFNSLMVSAEPDKIDAFLDRVLPPVAQAGSARKTDVMLRTIEGFLQSGRRYQETADRLGIHVSTLRYRLERIQESARIDFDDPDRCFELDLALRLRKMRNSYET